MNTVELHLSFRWDCDHCGKENIIRAIDADLDSDALEPLDGLEEDGDEDDEDGDEDTNELSVLIAPPNEGLADVLMERIISGPKLVRCKFCETEFESVIPGFEDEEGGDDE